MITTTRNATLHDLAALLQSQHARKVDLVAPASELLFTDGRLQLEQVTPVIEDDGVTSVDGVYLPTQIFDEGLSDKLGIPLPYLRKMRTSGRTDLFDMNVNGWLLGVDHGDPDPRSFLVRLFRGDDGAEGIARAFLSNGYKMVDNLDVLTAALKGVQEAGVEVQVAGCDLSERRMSIRVSCPQIGVDARKLLGGYRSPYSGQTAEDLPMLWAGFAIGNSETGGGAFTITPRAVFEVCSNGMTITRDQLREVHLGGRMDDGIVKWSDETQSKAVELVTLRTKDAVRTFLDRDYLQRIVDEATEKAGHEVPVTTAVQSVAKKLAFDEATTQGVLEAFMRSGTMTAGGVMQAVTAYAQVEEDPDKAAALEAAALPALEYAATL